MADSFGFIQYSVLASGAGVLYTCPIVSTSEDVGSAEDVVTYAQLPTTQSQVTSIIVTNPSAGTLTFDMWLTPAAGDTPADVNLIVSDISLSADESIILAQGLVLAPDNTVWIEGSSTGLVATLNRIEVS
jgi:hypothetical protein